MQSGVAGYLHMYGDQQAEPVTKNAWRQVFAVCCCNVKKERERGRERERERESQNMAEHQKKKKRKSSCSHTVQCMFFIEEMRQN
jgi:hypothetical protein